ncbi:hypothetical protein A4H97_30675 [Niastella yeongjuensis]|uniref:PA14 domain-containing protein n=1 Tax=Niastella yeongjuensis TaxID=354355 RepID=A0A1V9EP18_9BACT|nr:PA14 domain-containing protein [Niastella yeongjuensis]OQP47877.1 hypothetical protein A4H97_30675 [Niastella yeongjuensis]SEP48199.1 PA14 domain-containing protein [Niastella yeongjuensis]
MILSLAIRYQKHIALFLLSISFVQLTIAERIGLRYVSYREVAKYPSQIFSGTGITNGYVPLKREKADEFYQGGANSPLPPAGGAGGGRFIGGPTQPESQSFTSVNSNNMVDLFSGDFSYNIPLLDVGGYPVNIGYHSGITMDEDASWVGLGWNINPGSITRNLRGVPDDFNGGADTMKKVASVKPNVSWGVNIGASGEIVGLPKIGSIISKTDSLRLGGSLGIFHTTYTGWGMETSLNASINAGAKSFGGLTAGLSITNNSQQGVTVTPSLGYNSLAHKNSDVGGGFSISSPYNSRTGLRTVQLGMNLNPKNKDGDNIKGGSYDALSYSWPAAMPYMTMPMTNYNVSVTLKFGSEFTGFSPDWSVSGYYGQESIRSSDQELSLPVFGYLNYQNMSGNWNALTDFNREKEIPYREKPAVPHIAVPSYTYDVFSISGEGTGGSFRPYRGDIGFIADHLSQSKTISGGVSLDIGPGMFLHGGVDLNANYSTTKTGPWQAENVIGSTIGFRKNSGLYEGVYFRNPAEKAINTTAYYNAIGGDDVVTPSLFQLNSLTPFIIAMPTLDRYSGKKKVGSIPLRKDSVVHTTRDKRSQVISYLTAAEATAVGLDKYIYHYGINEFNPKSCPVKLPDETDGNGLGTKAYYYRNESLKGDPSAIRPDSMPFYNWGEGTPAIGTAFQGDHFSVRWLGRFKAPVTGPYKFAATFDDGMRLFVNDTLLMDRWKKINSWDSVKLNLVKDELYNMRIEYYDDWGSAHTEWFWRPPMTPNGPLDLNHKIKVPRKYLFQMPTKDTLNVDPGVVREDRVNNFRKASHISEIDVLNPDGRKYVYGIPVYNILQKEVSFAVEAGKGDVQTGLTDFTPTENSTGNKSGKDGYYSRQEMPGYAHSYLLTGILSPDYVDVTGDGISDDDQGDAVKFNYSKAAGIAAPFEWRAPYSEKANYNEGLKTYPRDDKAHYIYGKKEQWYLHTIESKTMIATFTLEHRQDMLEIDEAGNKRNNGRAFCLKQIDLYSKADFLEKGPGAIPIKTVHFEYSNELCPGINMPENNDGKLTLKKIWFTYNNNDKGQLNPYVFNYHPNNPAYRTNASDKWGTYKDPAQNPKGVNNADYPYALQDSAQAAYNAGAWMLDSIQLPSGGRIKVNYESDDYAYVQNRRATQMMEIVGLGQGATSTPAPLLYNWSLFDPKDNLYVFVKVPQRVHSKSEMYARYLEGLSKLYFRLSVQMPATEGLGNGSEYVPCYAEPDFAAGNWYGFTGDSNVIYIKIGGINKNADGGGSESALAQAAINFLRLNLPSKAYPGSEVRDDLDFNAGVQILVSQISNFTTMLQGFANSVRRNNWVSGIDIGRSFVRLNAPTFKKIGGGLRVKSVLIYDHWRDMTSNKMKESVYGQTYDYTTIQNINGIPARISSGVASWEPVIGGEENPFHLPIEYQDRISALAPASMLYSEEPLGESFYPGASIGYSKVRTRSIHTANTRSANGYSESTFFTSYDFPTTCDRSMLDDDTKKRFRPVLKTFLRINSISNLSISQGFKVELNDMNGKLRTEATYSETDAVHPITYTENFYHVDNLSTESKHLNNTVAVINPNGEVDTDATIGKDVELMADMRDQKSVSIGGNVNVNVDLFAAGVWPVAIPSLLNLFQREENEFRSAAMTKVIYRYGIIDSVVHIEKGSKVSTRNILYDSETGDPLLTRTQNEFNDPVYQFTYPAHWVYKGMGPAYQNIGATLEHLTVKMGKIDESGLVQPISSYLTAGDELLVYSKQSMSEDGCGNEYATFPKAYKLWVIDSSTVQGGTPHLYLVDANGIPFSGNDVTFKVIRSGHRNVNGEVGTVTSLNSPLVPDGAGKYHLVFDNNTKVINAGAAEMAQYWKVADRRKSDKDQNCVPTDESDEFNREACSCFQPFFNYLINNGQLFSRRYKSPQTVRDVLNKAGLTNLSGCSLLQANLDKVFYTESGPDDDVYTAYIGDVRVDFIRRPGSNASFNAYTIGSCTPEGVAFKNPNGVVHGPDTVTVRIAADYSANLLSTEQCPAFNDSLTTRDATSDRLLVENGLDVGGYERNAIAVVNFNRLDQIPPDANILSANMILQADQRGHGSGYTNANSVNLADTLSVSLANPGYFPTTSLEAVHERIITSAWHRELKKKVPFQNDTLNVLDYVNGYRDNSYTSASFMLTQGSGDFHSTNTGYGAGYEPPAYLQTGYGNYYSTYYSQRYADPAKWPVIEVTYVTPAPASDTGGILLTYNLTLNCSENITRSCYSAITDTMVNPYLYGILGNFRPLRGYVYYGSRNESKALPSVNVNTRTYGTIKDFAPFWILQDNNWVPSNDTTRWVWNSATTLFNRKGFELENKDPLGRYNAGLYGYGLTMPTAVLQNSHYQEGAYEGFEDYGFKINTCDTTCGEIKHFDFSGFQNSFTKTQAHTGLYSLQVPVNSSISIDASLQPAADADVARLTPTLAPDACAAGSSLKGLRASKNTIVPEFAPLAGKRIIVGGWVKEDNSCLCKAYTRNHILVQFVAGGDLSTVTLSPSGNLVEGWQRYEAVVDIPANATQMAISLKASDSATTWFDDIRIHPYNAQMKSFVYNPVNLRLMAELDENNYATFYEYDDDGTLVRVKKETERGVQTIKESRSALLKEHQ